MSGLKQHWVCCQIAEAYQRIEPQIRVRGDSAEALKTLPEGVKKRPTFPGCPLVTAWEIPGDNCPGPKKKNANANENGGNPALQ
jgi:hypothetical protein